MRYLVKDKNDNLALATEWTHELLGPQVTIQKFYANGHHDSIQHYVKNLDQYGYEMVDGPTDPLPILSADVPDNHGQTYLNSRCSSAFCDHYGFDGDLQTRFSAVLFDPHVGLVTD